MGDYYVSHQTYFVILKVLYTVLNLLKNQPDSVITPIFGLFL